jgi:outer membrane protein
MCQNNLLTTVLFLILTWGIQPLTSQTREYWTLEDCIEFAWQNNLQLQQQKLSVSIARENLIQSRANAYPNLNAGASHAIMWGGPLTLSPTIL